MSQNIEDLIKEKKEYVRTILEKEEFYEDPQKVFTEFANSLPDAKTIWQVTFIMVFWRSDLVERKLRHQLDANQR